MTHNPVRFAAIAILTLGLAACDGEIAGTHGADRLYGRWKSVQTQLPPVDLDLRREASGTVGQVWLSGVTYTLPAVLDDSMVVLADPASSAAAPFVGVLQRDGTLRATLGGDSKWSVTLAKVP